VVTFLVVSQYSGPVEPIYPAWQDESKACQATWSNPDPYPLAYRNTALFLESAGLLYRQDLSLPREPQSTRPRVYGNDSAWLSARLQPFDDAPCEPTAMQNVGTFGEAGVWDGKGYFDFAAKGYVTCSKPPFARNDIGSVHAAARYLEAGHGPPRFIDGKRVLFLLRELWACNASAGSFDECAYDENQTAVLAAALVASDMTSFLTVESGATITQNSPVSWLCGANPNSGDVCTFDLSVEVQVAYFSLWYDVLASRAELVSPANLTLVARGLRERIDLFRNQFLTGHWSLWNGQDPRAPNPRRHHPARLCHTIARPLLSILVVAAAIIGRRGWLPRHSFGRLHSGTRIQSHPRCFGWSTTSCGCITLTSTMTTACRPRASRTPT
jgi:hypothetical protein